MPSSDNLAAHREVIKTMIQHVKNEDALATALMRQARYLHNSCQERLERAQAMLDALEAEIGAGAATTVPTEDIPF